MLAPRLYSLRANPEGRPTSRLAALFSDPWLGAALLFSFILVFMKKWEPGGNIDAIWYEAISKNVANSGDFFHFYVSKNYGDVWDHMPLTYWVDGAIMRAFGVSDFIARLYPMACSFASCIFVYLSARRMSPTRPDSSFGLIALVCYSLCVGAMKWNGSLMQDVPLTTCFLGCYWSLLNARTNRAWLCATGAFFGLGVLTKGPIIFGFAGAAALWILWERRWRLMASPWFLAGLAVASALIFSLFLPELRFNGRPYYELFYEAKKSYVAPSTGGWTRHFAYLEVLWTGAFLMIPLAVVSIARELRSQTANAASAFSADREAAERRAGLRLAALCAFCVAAPLSFFAVKFPHYMLPVYPFIALLAAATVERLVPFAWRERLPKALARVSIGAALLFVAFPIKITGQRSKDVLNVVNAVKLDDRLREKEVVFVGKYEDEMSALQSFKLYGSIDLAMKDAAWAAGADLAKTWLVIPRAKLPIPRDEGPPITEADCLVVSESLCALTDHEHLRFAVPNDAYPHEVY